MVRRLLKPKLLLLLIIVAAMVYGIFWFRQGIRMPGRSYSGPLQPLDAYQARLRDNLKTHVQMLAGQIGERNLQHLEAINRSADYIRQNLEQNGYTVSEDSYQAEGAKFRILYTNTLGGSTASEPFVIGAHYDSVVGS